MLWCCFFLTTSPHSFKEPWPVAVLTRPAAARSSTAATERPPRCCALSCKTCAHGHRARGPTAMAGRMAFS